MKKLSKIDIALGIFYLIAIISIFFPYSKVKSGEIVDEYKTREVFFETTFYWHENYGIFFVLGFTLLIVVTSFSESNWINKLRNIVFSLFAIGILGFMTISKIVGNYGPIPQMTFFYYSMIFAILSIIVLANIKTWQKKSLN